MAGSGNQQGTRVEPSFIINRAAGTSSQGFSADNLDATMQPVFEMCEMIEVDRNIVIVPRINDIGAPLQCLEESNVAPSKRVPAKRLRTLPFLLLPARRQPARHRIASHETGQFLERRFLIQCYEELHIIRALTQQLERMRYVNRCSAQGDLHFKFRLIERSSKHNAVWTKTRRYALSDCRGPTSACCPVSRPPSRRRCAGDRAMAHPDGHQ